MLLLPSIKVKPLLSPKQIQYDNTTSLLVAIHTWRIVGVVFLWGISGNLTSSLWNTCRSRGYFDWDYSNTLRVLSEKRIWLVQICSYSLECPRHRGLGQCGQSWFDHFFRIWHINNDNFPMGYSSCRGGTTCTDAAWNHSLSSKVQSLPLNVR